MPFALPIRRSPEVIAAAAPSFSDRSLANDVMVRSSEVEDDVQLVVHGGGTREQAGPAWLKERLKFKSTSSGPLRRRVGKREKKAFAGELARLLKETKEKVEKAQQRIALADDPGLLPGDSPEPGRLVYTAHPLDLAMPDAGRGVRYFLAIRERGGPVTYSRGGRLFVDENGRLALREGVTVDEIVVPPEARAVRVLPRGVVESVQEDGTVKVLGRLRLVTLRELRGKGRTYDGTPGVPLQAGESGVPLFKPGHLEFPRVRVADEAEHLAACERDVRLLQRIELGLAEPFRQQTVTHPIQLVQPVDPIRPVDPQPVKPPRHFPLMIAADIPLTVAHLKALGFKVETAPGRAVIPTGEDDEARGRLVDALTKILEGLRKRMDIAQLNYNNANRLRDEQGKLNPYRRKLIRVGPEGELLEAEDETPFRKEFNPNHPDVGPDGSVLFPNVNRLVEKADFEQAATEYRLIRTAIERLAPSIIFPDPPELQVQPETKTKAP